MNNEMKTQVRAAAVQWVNEMVYQNQIAVEDVEDALYYALVQIKDQIIMNLSTQLLQQQIDQAAVAENQEFPIEEGEEDAGNSDNNSSGNEVVSGD